MGSEGSASLNEEFGTRLREYRERAGLSVADVCRVYGYRAAYLVSLEEGKVKELPAIFRINSLMKLYRCSQQETIEIADVHRKACRSLPIYRKMWRGYDAVMINGPVKALHAVQGEWLGVFISYRRSDEGAFAGRLYDSLTKKLGKSVFMDVDSIEMGLEYEQVLRRSIRTCQVMIAVIGRDWLTAKDETGRRRLDDPNDLVRREIEEGLEQGIRVIPVLVDGAAMPTVKDLPDSLTALRRRNAHHMWNRSFGTDCRDLIDVLKKIQRNNYSDA